MSQLCSSFQVPVLVFLVAALAGNVLHVTAYPSGAGTQACAAQSPQICHKGSPQTSASPYVLVVNSTTYSPGTTIQVTIQVANGSTPFKGFLVGAHRVEGNTTEYLGSFASTPDSQPRCGDNGNTGATHINSTAKTTVALVWGPPATIEGTIVFKAAVVRKFNSYWTNVSSEILTPGGYPPTIQTTTTPQPSMSHFRKDPGCGKTKACFGDCQGDHCNFQATWYKVDQSLIVTLKSVVNFDENVWAGLGFGTDANMNPASVTHCVAFNGMVQAFTAYNKDFDSRRVTPNDKIGLSNVNGSVKDGVFTCTFNRLLIVNGGGVEVYNLTRNFHVLMARGLASEWTIQPHEQHNAFVTHDSYDVTSHVDIGAHATSTGLVKLHGCFMTLAWLFASSIGVLMARFFKPVWPSRTVCGVQVWFAIHRLAMMVAVIATSVGFIIIFIHVGGWSQINGPEYKKAHPILGTIVTSLTVINPIMALFRCDPRHESRPVFNWAHFLVGSSAYILGVVTVGIGIHMPLTDIPDYVTMCVIGFGAWHVLIHLTLEVIKCCERNYSTKKTLTVSHSSYGEHTVLLQHDINVQRDKYHLPRQVLFTGHVLVSLGVCITVICFITGFEEGTE